MNYSLGPKHRENLKVIVVNCSELHLTVLMGQTFERKAFAILGAEGDLDPPKSIRGDGS